MRYTIAALAILVSAAAMPITRASAGGQVQAVAGSGPVVVTDARRAELMVQGARVAGRLYGCDGNLGGLRRTLARFAFVLGAKDVGSAGSAVETGVEEARANPSSCSGAAPALASFEEGFRSDQQGLMVSLMNRLATVAGAAIECGIPQDQVAPVLARATAYTRIEAGRPASGDFSASRLGGWAMDGVAAVRSKQSSCTDVTTALAFARDAFEPMPTP